MTPIEHVYGRRAAHDQARRGESRERDTVMGIARGSDRAAHHQGPVDTDWDLRIGDAMAIWFSQSLRSGEIPDDRLPTERPFGRSKAHSPAHYDWLASCVNNRITGSVRHISESAPRRLVANSPQRRVDLVT